MTNTVTMIMVTIIDFYRTSVAGDLDNYKPEAPALATVAFGQECPSCGI